MKNEDMTLAAFRSIILSRSNYLITDDMIEEFWEEGDSIEDTLKWCQWMSESPRVGNLSWCRWKLFGK